MTNNNTLYILKILGIIVFWSGRTSFATAVIIHTLHIEALKVTTLF